MVSHPPTYETSQFALMRYHENNLVKANGMPSLLDSAWVFVVPPVTLRNVSLPKVSPHPPCDSPNTSRRFALGASNVCLVRENPTCSVPAL